MNERQKLRRHEILITVNVIQMCMCMRKKVLRLSREKIDNYIFLNIFEKNIKIFVLKSFFFLFFEIHLIQIYSSMIVKRILNKDTKYYYVVSKFNIQNTLYDIFGRSIVK